MQIIFALVGIIVAIGAYFLYDAYVAKAPAASSPETEMEMRESANVPTSASLNRSGRNLTEMPKDILSMTNLRELNLSNNQITGALPAEIRFLSNLEVLNISNNNMTGLPAEVGQLSKLRILNAANNQLTGIPHELGNLQNLERLDLSGNDISEFDLNEIRKKLPASTQIIL